MYKSYFKNIILLVLFATIFSACGVWTNFKTYYNRYYNAKELFEKVEAELQKLNTDFFYFEEPQISKSINKDLDVVVKKNLEILRYNKDSDYVDDALFMTGRSFYYQKNYSRALRKFNELGAIKDSELSTQNKLWIAKTYFQLREYEKAQKVIDKVIELAKKEDEQDILSEAYRTKISYLIYIEEYDLAAEEIAKFFSTDIDDEIRAEVLFEEGRLYKINNNLEEAQKAFELVNEYSPTFDLEFKSKFEVANIVAEKGDVEKSLELLNEIRDEDKYSDNWKTVDLEIGQILYDKKEIDNALDKFTEVDTTYNNTEEGGIAGFYRGEILDKFFNDYDSALVFYKKAANANIPTTIRNVARKRSNLLNQYLKYHKTAQSYKTQLLYLTDPDAFIQDSLDYVYNVKQDSIKRAELSQNRNEQRSSQRQRMAAANKILKPVKPKISVDSVHALTSKTYFELANLLFTEFDNPDSAFYYYQLALDEDPYNPNEAQIYYAMGSYYLTKDDKVKADSMFTLVYNKFQFDPIRNEAAKQIGKPIYNFEKDPVEEEYMEFESIYDQKKYDDAIEKLFDIYKKHPNSIYAPKSLYAIGYILENDLFLPDSAAAIYKVLNAKYKSSEYSSAILQRLSGYNQEQMRLENEAKKLEREKEKQAGQVTEESKNEIDKTKLEKQLEDRNNGKLKESDTSAANKKIIDP